LLKDPGIDEHLGAGQIDCGDDALALGSCRIVAIGGVRKDDVIGAERGLHDGQF